MVCRSDLAGIQRGAGDDQPRGICRSRFRPGAIASPVATVAGRVTNRQPADQRGTAPGRQRSQVLVDVPPSIGPVVFGTSGVAWVMVRCPSEYHDLMRRAGGVWEPGARQWLVERRRIGPVIRELERSVDPLFRQAGIRLD